VGSSPGGSGPGGVGALVRPTALRASARNTLALHSAACPTLDAPPLALHSAACPTLDARNTLALHSAACRDVPPLARLLAQRCGAPASPLANGLSEHAVRAAQARGFHLCVCMRGSDC